MANPTEIALDKLRGWIALTEGSKLTATAELPADLRVVEAELLRLAAARVVTCVYCGHAYQDGTPESQNERLTAHIKVCDKHPMRTAEARIERLVAVADIAAKMKVEWLAARNGCADLAVKRQLVERLFAAVDAMEKA